VDEQKLSLNDCRGKLVLLNFWATWCGPCRAEVPHLKELHTAFTGTGRFAMISLSLDDDPSAPAKFAERNHLEWTQGFLGEWAQAELPDAYGVTGIPALFLVSPDGKLIAKGLRGDELKQAIADALDNLSDTPP
jgi:thiol-disulfide isomerase/thioredoxin